MIPWMLERLARSPSAVFYERELRAKFPSEFQEARLDGLLHRLPLRLDGGSYGFGLSSPLSVIDEAGTLEAFDDEDPEADPVTLAPADLAQWSVDLGALARRYQQSSGLTGEGGSLDYRLYFLGSVERDGLRLGCVLGLVHERRSALTHLRAVRNLLPVGCDRVVVVCPDFAPAPEERRELAALDVFAVQPGRDQPFAVDWAAALEGPVPIRPRVVLTEAEEERFQANGCLSRLPIHITGTVLRGRHLLEVGGRRVRLTNADFRFFLRLVVALCETDDGFLSRKELRKHTEGPDWEGNFAPEGLDQAATRLRIPFGPALGALEPTDFIETQRGRGRQRISTHRRYVSWNETALEQHQDAVIRALVARLSKGREQG